MNSSGPDTATYWIEKYLPNEQLNVVQVGANDGVAGDPIRDLVLKKNHWQVIFVEPVPYLFKQLKHNYGDAPRFTFENLGINETGENQPFYSVKEAAFHTGGFRSTYNQIGSFSRDHLLDLSEGLLEGWIEPIEVECMTLTQMLEKNGLKRLDFLSIDAEGYDWKVLSTLQLERFSPAIIFYEHLNLSPADLRAAREFLEEEYHQFTFGIDHLCIRKSLLSPADLELLAGRSE